LPLLFSQLEIEVHGRQPPMVEIVQVQLFVGGVGVLVGEADADEKDWGLEQSVEGGDNRDRLPTSLSVLFTLRPPKREAIIAACDFRGMAPKR